MHASSNAANFYPNLLGRFLAAAAVAVAASGNTEPLKGFKDAHALESAAPLAEAKDERILASIETVIRRNDPNTWARETEWDEYLIRIRSLSGDLLEIREVAVFDALDYRIESRADRSALVNGTREIEQRYEQAGRLVRRRGVSGWIIAGAGIAIAGGLAASAVHNTGFLAWSAPEVAMVSAVSSAGVVYLGAGAAHLVELAQVNDEIQRRRTRFPMALPSGAEASVDVFFPISPQSGRTQVVYADRNGEHRLDIDTRQALVDTPSPTPLLVSRVDPKFPDLARRAGIESGYVTAELTLDREGHVRAVDVIEAVPLGVFTQEARRTFPLWTYSAGNADGRAVEARLEFKR